MRDGRARWVAEVLALAAAYLVTARLGLSFEPIGGAATTVWPPAGIAVAALLLLGTRAWPGVTIGAFLANWLQGLPLAAIGMIAIGNTLEAVVAATLLARLDFKGTLARLRDVVLLGAVAPVACVVAASIGTFALWSTGSPVNAPLSYFWVVWLVGDTLGMLVVAPMIFVWTLQRPPTRQGAEAILLGALLVLATVIIFGGVEGFPPQVRRAYFLAPLTVWASLRFGPLGAATSTLLITVVGVALTVSGRGPYVGGVESQNLLGLALFIAVGSINSLFLGAAAARVRERERAVRLREDFISLAAHELRGAATTLKLRCQMLQRGLARGAWEPGILVRALTAAEQQIDRLVQLIGALLDVARIRAEALHLERAPADLVEVVRAVVARLGEQLEASECALEMWLPEQALGQFDVLRIDQVLDNLLTNAMKHGRGRPITVGLELSPGRARLSVTDRGPGVPKPDRERIFLPFERAAKDAPGLGLGLYIARQIVEAHGGTIRVEGEPGEGSTFVVELPLEASA